MNNNDILIRIRYALDIKDKDMVKIFKLGGAVLSEEEVAKMLQKSNKEDDNDSINFNHIILDKFLKGLIVFKRGARTDENVKTNEISLKNNGNFNNILLKQLKIALSLSSEDMLEIFELAGNSISKGELSAIFRKEGHRNYRECGDKYVRNFLKGLAIKYRS